MLKVDEKHPKFRGKVLCSAGIGAGYLKREDSKRHVYIPGKTNESYRMKNGGKLNLPHPDKLKLLTSSEVITSFCTVLLTPISPIFIIVQSLNSF